jgi:hypothetical protein
MEDNLETNIYEVLNFPPTDSGSCLSSEGFQILFNLSQCAVLPRILQTYIIGFGKYPIILFEIHVLLDISWADLRDAMCPLRHFIGGTDTEALHKLLWFMAEHLSPEITITQLSLELAQGWLKLEKDPNRNLTL